MERKRRKLNGAEDVPGFSLGESTMVVSTVVWKPKNDVLQPFEGLVVSQGRGETISKNWRDGLRSRNVQYLGRLKCKDRVVRRQFQWSSAASLQPVSSQSVCRAYLQSYSPTNEFLRLAELPSRSADSPSNTNGTSSTTNRMTRATSFQDVPFGGNQ